MDLEDNSVALTITSPPYWKAIDYNVHIQDKGKSYRSGTYEGFGDTYTDWLQNIKTVFDKAYHATIDGGFCAIVIGTILHEGKMYFAPFDMSHEITTDGNGLWTPHEVIVWNKVTGGVRRAGSYIQHPKMGYYYPNIMTEFILVYRKGNTRRRGTAPALPVDDLFTKDIANNIWHIAPVPPKTVDHPCPYPEEIVRRLVYLYSQSGDIVLDPFLGSGTTAKVALQNDRQFTGYEVISDYVTLTMNRITEPTKRKYHLIPKVEKISTGDP